MGGAPESWRLVRSFDGAPEFNMGFDEALLNDSEAAPTVRVYTWSPDTLSLGYFQKWGSVPGKEAAGAMVRRITGGGAIHHVHELTFSLALDASHALVRGPVVRSYERIHAAVMQALRTLGVNPALAGQNSLDSDRQDTGMCFHASTPLDVVWGGRKGVGSAQRRRGGRVLHHGSIKLGSSDLEGEIATLSGKVTPHEMADSLLAAMEQCFGVQFDEQDVTQVELEQAQSLGARYSSEGFLHRK